MIVAVIVGCLPPFKTFLSRSNSTYESRYPPVYGGSGLSRRKRSVTQTTSWSETQLEQEYELSSRQVLVSAGREESPSRQGEILVTQDFVSIPSKSEFILTEADDIARAATRQGLINIYVRVNERCRVHTIDSILILAT